METVDHVEDVSWRRGDFELCDRTAPNLRQKRLHLEFDRLGGAHVLEYAFVPSEHAQQLQIGVVADGKDVSAWAMHLRQRYPLLAVPGAQLATVDGAAGHAAVGQENNVSFAIGCLALVQCGLQCELKICAAAQAAGANEIQRLVAKLSALGDGHANS